VVELRLEARRYRRGLPSATGGETYRWLLADDRARRIWPAAETWTKDFG
jgi:hypothetical protein